MSRRNIKIIQNLIIISLIIWTWGFYQLSEKYKVKKIAGIGKKVAVTQSLKDCLKANASPELREATKGIQAPKGKEYSVMSFLAHFKSAIPELSPEAYADAYATLEKCGIGTVSGD